MKIVNLTPHPLNIWNEKTQKFTSFETEGCVRLNHNNRLIGEFNGIPLYETTVSARSELPEKKDDVIYIVSSVVLSAFSEREDFWQPGRLLRDEKKKVIGCVGLSRQNVLLKPDLGEAE